MSPRKEYFDEPLVKVDLLKARFPRTCPVCGAPATDVVRMKIAKTGKQALRRTWDYPYTPYIRRRQESSQLEMKVLVIQVCEDHAHPDDGTDRYQSLCFIVDGLLMAFVIFSFLFIGDRIARSQPLPLWPFVYMGLFGLALMATKIAFSPNELEKAVSIVGLGPGAKDILLAFKRLDYRDLFLKENQMTAELVTWIMRADD
ncbi:MAG: hypothetical protein AM325_015350 [Candidatus Thorarchaeota archaeon SMTZ1-45]